MHPALRPADRREPTATKRASPQGTSFDAPKCGSPAPAERMLRVSNAVTGLGEPHQVPVRDDEARLPYTHNPELSQFHYRTFKNVDVRSVRADTSVLRAGQQMVTLTARPPSLVSLYFVIMSRPV